MYKEHIFKCDRECIPEAIDFIRNVLTEKKVNRNNVVKSALAAEEILEKICEVAQENSQITVGISSLFNEVKIKYSAKGGKFTVADIQQKLLFDETSLDEDTSDVMNVLLEKLFGKNISIKCDNRQRISVVQQVEKSPYKLLIATLVVLVLGILVGIFIQNFIPEVAANWLIDNIVIPIYTILINALKLVVAPLVFFSIASSIAEFTDIKALGRIAFKIVITYILTSIIATCVGLLTYKAFPIGNASLAKGVDAQSAMATIEKGATATISVKETLVSIVPVDIVTPFQTSNMLQIIFMAICLGLATATISNRAPVAKEFINGMNMVFSKITEAIVSAMPILVFCAMVKMAFSMDLKSFIHVITWIPVIYLGCMIMILVYMLLILINGLNPLKFINKYYPAMISAFTLQSSNAALPTSIKQCKKIGISEKIYSFSLPLGATINMDGNCITLIISALFFAKIYEMPITGSMLLQLFLAIIVLSVGAPGVPGGNLVCLTLLVPQIGIPAEAISLVIGLYPIVSMMQTMANVVGDAVVTTIVAKSEKMLDLNMYNDKVSDNGEK